MIRRLVATALAGAVVAAGGVAQAVPGAAQRTPSIAIVGWKVSKHNVTLKVKITGWRMVAARTGPGAKFGVGHWEIFANGSYAGYSTNPSTGTVTGLPTGICRIHVELARRDFTRPSPPVRSRTIVVRIP